MAEKISAPRGTHDILPGQTAVWQWLEGILRDTARRFSFQEIRIPTFEHTELFLRGVGDTTDIVQKEMYTFEDKGGRSITLRPEGTASVVRAFVEHSVYAAAMPFKVYYISPNFRYEKPQAGRLREHHQLGVECFGPASPAADAEVIDLGRAVLDAAGLVDISLRLNSIGCPDCRPRYLDALRAHFATRREELCHACQGRLQRNPLRVLDCKSPVCQSLAADAPLLREYLCPACVSHQEGLEAQLSAMGIAYQYDPRLVRGFDYYTQTVFEFTTDCIGAQNAVCGGGRYNFLVETLGGPSTPALGFGMGLERLLLVLEAQGLIPTKRDRCQIFIATRGQRANLMAAALTTQLRTAGLQIERDLMGRSLKAQMKAADRLDASFTLVLGDDELEAGRGVLKRMDGDGDIPCTLEAEAIVTALAE